jgi:hypothetical protein
MKVLNLRCSNDHLFEGWFASDDDFASQGERGLVSCPMCNDTSIFRLPSAPRLNVSKQRDVVSAEANVPVQAQMQAHWLRAVRHMMKNTEDVGDRFPEEARRIHYGETQERGIRGRASPEDAHALREEGIEVVAVALPEPLKEPLQ